MVGKIHLICLEKLIGVELKGRSLEWYGGSFVVPSIFQKTHGFCINRDGSFPALILALWLATFVFLVCGLSSTSARVLLIVILLFSKSTSFHSRARISDFLAPV